MCVLPTSLNHPAARALDRHAAETYPARPAEKAKHASEAKLGGLAMSARSYRTPTTRAPGGRATSIAELLGWPNAPTLRPFVSGSRTIDAPFISGANTASNAAGGAPRLTNTIGNASGERRERRSSTRTPFSFFGPLADRKDASAAALEKSSA